MAKEVTKAMYEFALQRIEELLPVTPDCAPEDDPRMAELAMVSGIVEEYENIHYPIPQPTVGEIIADAMDEKMMSGEELAQRIGVSPHRISDYITGRAEPTLKIARLLCQVLKIHPSEFQNKQQNQIVIMEQIIKSEQVKDVIVNLKDALYWTNRVNNDPSQVNLPSDEYDQPAQASLAITQAITLLNQLIQGSGDTNQE